MDTKSNLIKLSIIIVLFSWVSCNSSNYKIDKQETTSNDETLEFVLVDSTVLEFYSFLEKGNYEKCLSYFSKELRNNPGDSILMLGLSERDKKMGRTLEYEILYSYTIESETGDKYGFHTKCFNNNDLYHFENLLFIGENDRLVLENYEYSNLPYVSLEKANDPSSALNIFLDEMYKKINTDNFEDVRALIDEFVFEKLGEEKLVNGFKEQVSIKPDVIGFEVRRITTDFKKEIPIIELLINEKTNNGLYASSVKLLVRRHSFKVYSIEEASVLESAGTTNTLIVDKVLVSEYVTGFYKALKDSNYEIIMSYVDDEVFKNNSEKLILESFRNRNVYYGTPEDSEILSFENTKIGNRNAIVINTQVTGDKQKVSAEKIVLVEYKESEHKLYAYEYNELID